MPKYEDYVRQANILRKKYGKDTVALNMDKAYLKFYHEIVKFEQENPSRISPESPTQQECDSPNTQRKPHAQPMIGYNSTTESKDIAAYWKQFEDVRNTNGVNYTDNFYCDYKLDGISLELWYRDNKLVGAITRGDGVYGDDVTDNMKHITSIPQTICCSDLLIIKGEAIVHRCEYDLVNRYQRDNQCEEFDDAKAYLDYCLHNYNPTLYNICTPKFYAWALYCTLPCTGDGIILSQIDSMHILADKLGFMIPTGRLCHNVKEIMQFIKDADLNRANLPYDISGVMIKQNNLKLAHQLGRDDRHLPLADIEFKFKSRRSDATITKIHWDIDRVGRLMPKASITPITIGETKVTEVDLINAVSVITEKLGVGAKITVYGDGTNFKVNEVLEPADVEIPDICPYCGAKLVKVRTDIRCINKQCKAKFIEGLLYLFNEVFHFKKINRDLVRTMVDHKIITNLLDIFHTLDSKDSGVPQEILDHIVARAQKLIMSELLLALNIPHINKAYATQIAAITPTIEKFIQLMHNPERVKWELKLPLYHKECLCNWIHDEDNLKLLRQIQDLHLAKV